MKLETLKEAKLLNRGFTVSISVDEDTIQHYADEYEDGDFNRTAEHLQELIENVLDNDQYVADSFNY